MSRGQGGSRIAKIAVATLVGSGVFDAHIGLSIVLLAFILCDTVLLLDEILTN